MFPDGHRFETPTCLIGRKKEKKVLQWCYKLFFVEANILKV
jgi:hypothetical protein